jgi:hypothetical protein
MDDQYTQPKDAIMFEPHHKSALHTNFYSDEDDDEDDGYTQPFFPGTYVFTAHACVFFLVFAAVYSCVEGISIISV